MRFSPRVLLAATAVLLCLAGCNRTKPAEQARAGQDSSKSHAAPDFTLKDADGKEVKLSDLKGKVVLLNFWATWCGPCKMEIPWFIEFERQYKDKGFAVVGVAMDDDGWNAVKPYIAAQKVNYRVVVGTDAVAQNYGGIDSLPTTFILDREGRITSTHVGLVAKSEYEHEITQLLQ